jgi:hypothetical protein
MSDTIDKNTKEQASAAADQAKAAGAKASAAADKAKASAAAAQASVSSLASDVMAKVDLQGMFESRSKFPKFVEDKLSGLSSERALLVTTVAWMPVIALIVGVFSQTLLLLILQNLHFIAGGASFYYILSVLNNGSLAPNEKAKQVYPFALVAPVLIVSAPGSFVTSLLVMVAFASTIFVSRVYFPAKTAIREAELPLLQRLELGIPAAVVYSLSAGSCCFIEAAVNAGVYFAVSTFALPAVWPQVEPHLAGLPIPAELKDESTFFKHAISIVLAHLAWTLVASILPLGLLGEHNSIFLALPLAIIGLAFMAAFIFLAATDNAQVKPIKKDIILGIVGLNALLIVIWSM